MQPETSTPSHDLYRWYLALMRTDAKARSDQKPLTPLSLMQQDMKKIQSLISETSTMAPPAVPSAGVPAVFRALPGGAELAARVDKLHQQVEALAHELEQAKQGERLIADYTSDLLCCLDEKRLIVDVNLQFELTSGYQKLSLIAVPIDTLLASEEKDRFASGVFECAIAAADRSRIDLQWNVEWSETARHFFCRAQNISERKERERLKSRLASVARHDLREPLSGIGLCLDNLELGTYGTLNESGLQSVRLAYEKVQQMVRLIDQLVTSELKI